MARWILSLLIFVGLSAADAQWHASGNDGWSSDLSPYPESYPEVSPYGVPQEVHPYGNRPDAVSRDSGQPQNTPSRPISSREDKFVKEREGQERTPSTHSEAAPKETGSRPTHEQTHGDWGIGRPNPRPNNRRRSQDSLNKKSPNAVETRRETLDIGFDEKEKDELKKYETGYTATGNNAAGFPGHTVDSSSDSNQKVVGSEIIPPGTKTAFDSPGTEPTTPSTHYANVFRKQATHSPAKRFPGPGYWQKRRYTERRTPTTTTTTTTTPVPHDVYEPNLFHSAPENLGPESANNNHNQYNGGSGGSPVRPGEHHEPVLRAHRLPNPIRNSHPRPYAPTRLRQQNNRPTFNSPTSNTQKTISHAEPQQRPRFNPTNRFHPNPREEQINRRGNVSPFNRHRSNSIHDDDFKKGASYRPRPFAPKNTHPEAAESDSYHVNTPSHPTGQFFPHNSHPEATESGIYHGDRLQHLPRPFAPHNTHSETAGSDSYHVNRPSHRGDQFLPPNSQPEATESGSYHGNRLSHRPRPFFRQDPQPVAPEAESDSYNVKRPSRMSSYPNGEFVEPFRPSHSVSRPTWESHNAKRVSSTNSHFGQGNHFNRVAASRPANSKSFSSSFDTPNRFNKRPSTKNFYPGKAHPEGANRRFSTRRPAISNRFSPNGNHHREERRRPNRLFGVRPTTTPGNPNGRPGFNHPNTISSRNLNRESFTNTGRIIYPVKPGPSHVGQFNRANRYLGRNKNRESISRPSPFSHRNHQPAPVFNRPNRFPSTSPSQENLSDAATGFSPLQTGREAGFNSPRRFSTWNKNSGETRRFNYLSQRSNRGKPIVNRPNIPSVESLRPKSFYSEERVNPQNRFYPMDIQRETENIVDTPSGWDSYSNSRINGQVSPFEFDILEDPFEESFY